MVLLITNSCVGGFTEVCCGTPDYQFLCWGFHRGLQDVAFLSSGASFYSTLIVMEINISGLPHGFRLWLKQSIAMLPVKNCCYMVGYIVGKV